MSTKETTGQSTKQQAVEAIHNGRQGAFEQALDEQYVNAAAHVLPSIVAEAVEADCYWAARHLFELDVTQKSDYVEAAIDSGALQFLHGMIDAGAYMNNTLRYAGTKVSDGELDPEILIELVDNENLKLKRHYSEANQCQPASALRSIMSLGDQHLLRFLEQKGVRENYDFPLLNATGTLSSFMMTELVRRGRFEVVQAVLSPDSDRAFAQNVRDMTRKGVPWFRRVSGEQRWARIIMKHLRSVWDEVSDDRQQYLASEVLRSLTRGGVPVDSCVDELIEHGADPSYYGTDANDNKRNYNAYQNAVRKYDSDRAARLIEQFQSVSEPSDPSDLLSYATSNEQTEALSLIVEEVDEVCFYYMKEPIENALLKNDIESAVSIMRATTFEDRNNNSSIISDRDVKDRLDRLDWRYRSAETIKAFLDEAESRAMTGIVRDVPPDVLHEVVDAQNPSEDRLNQLIKTALRHHRFDQIRVLKQHGGSPWTSLIERVTTGSGSIKKSGTGCEVCCRNFHFRMTKTPSSAWPVTSPDMPPRKTARRVTL